MASYRAILKQSWKISWKNKFLWFFGFFASLISFGAEFKIISRSISQETGFKMLNNIGMFIKTGIFSKNALGNIFKMAKTDTSSFLSFALFIFVILAISLFFVWLATVSQVSIIDAVKKITKNTKEKLKIKNQLKKARTKFWPVLWMNLIMGLMVNGITLLISILLMFILIQNKPSFLFLYGIIFIAFIPIILFLSFVIKYAIAYTVIDGKKFSSAFKNGWKLFKNNWLISMEMTITLFFINILAMLVVSILAFLGLVFIIGIAMTSAIFITSSQFIFWSLIVIAILFAVSIMTIGGSIVNTFQISTWTNLFIKLKEKKISGKLERVFAEKNTSNKI